MYEDEDENDENGNDENGGATGADRDGEDGGQNDDADRKKQRRVAKERRHRQKLREERDAALTKLQEYEERDAAADEDRQRKAGEYEKLVANRDKKISALEAERDKAIAEAEELKANARSGAFLQKIVKEGGIVNAEVAGRLLRTLDIDDTSPEDPSDRDVRDAVKELQKVAPEIFGSGSDKPKPTPRGVNNEDRNDPEYWRNRAHERTSRTGTNAYDEAKKKSGGS